MFLSGAAQAAAGRSGGAVATGGELGEGLAAAGDVLAHQLFAARDIAPGQRVEEAPVFGEGLPEAAVAEQRVVARQFDDLAQVGDGLGQPAVAGDVLDFLVEGLVGLEETVDVVGVGGPLEIVVDRAQLVEVGLAGLAGGVGGALAFEQRHDGEDLVQVALGDLGDVAAAPRLERHQTLGGEHLEGLPQRGARDPVVGGQGLLVHPGAGRQFVGKNALAQSLRDFLVQG